MNSQEGKKAAILRHMLNKKNPFRTLKGFFYFVNTAVTVSIAEPWLTQ